MQKVILFSASNWWRSTNLGKFWCYLAAITKISFCEKIMPCSAGGLLNSLRNLAQWSCKNKRQVCLLEFDSQPVALFSLMRKEWLLGTVTVTDNIWYVDPIPFLLARCHIQYFIPMTQLTLCQCWLSLYWEASQQKTEWPWGKKSPSGF